MVPEQTDYLYLPSSAPWMHHFSHLLIPILAMLSGKISLSTNISRTYVVVEYSLILRPSSPHHWGQIYTTPWMCGYLDLIQLETMQTWINPMWQLKMDIQMCHGWRCTSGQIRTSSVGKRDRWLSIYPTVSGTEMHHWTDLHLISWRKRCMGI